MTATVNNNSVTTNVQDVLPPLLRMSDPDELAEYDATTPTTLDYLANYRDGVDTLGYQIIAATNADAALRPAVLGVGTGGRPAAIGSTGIYATGTAKFQSYPSIVLSYDMSCSVSGGKYMSPWGEL